MTEGPSFGDFPPFELGPDPYPELPVLPPEALRDGDVLMMLGEGWVRIGWLRLPVSWLIRALDGGAYSHSALVTLVDGTPRVWDHSEAWALAPVDLHAGIAKHAWCHVYRFRKHGESLGSQRYPAAPVVDVLNAHRGDPYDKTLLLLAGIVAVLSRMPEDPSRREALRKRLELLVAMLEWLLQDRDVRAGMLICTAVTGMGFWQARHEAPHDYALEVDLQRKGSGVQDADWERTTQKLRDVLARLLPELPEDLATWQHARSSNAAWVEVGGPMLPVNLVSPSDLEFSRTLERVGKLEIPRTASAARQAGST